MSRFGLYLILLLSGLCLSWELQKLVPMVADVSYLMHVAQLLMSGGRYGYEFSETNPPLILYLYMPPIWFSHLTKFNLNHCMIAYVLSLCGLSYSICYYYLQKIIQSPFVIYSLLLVMLFVGLYLPAFVFGQREVLFVMLIMPYLFAAVCALSEIPVNGFLGFLVGIMAAFGFGLKPYFLAPLILIESYFIVHFRHLFAWVRVETLVIMTLLVVYLATTYYFYPEYFAIILPLVNQYYFIGIAEPWSDILRIPMVQFSLFLIFIGTFLLRYAKLRMMAIVLWLAAIGGIFALFLTKTSWFYHAVPAMAFSILFVMYLLLDLFSPLTKSNGLALLAASIAVMYRPIILTMALVTCSYFIKQEEYRQNLMAYLRVMPGEHSLSCFSATADCFPLAPNYQFAHGSRYPFFWWLPGIVKTGNPPGYPINTVAEDLNHLRPHWVVINREKMKFNILAYFAKNPDFNQAWKSYKLVKKLDVYDIYERSNGV